MLALLADLALKFSSDEEDKAAGFVLNKLYTFKCLARRSNLGHGRHTELRNMQKGYPPDKRGLVNAACKKMDNKLVVIFKSTGEDHICALNDEEALKEGLEICNRYRKGVGLPPLDRYFKEMRERIESEEKKETAVSNKERRTREYFEKVKRWMQEQGLS